MKATLLKALVALVPFGLLLARSAALFRQQRTLFVLLQVVGSVCLVIVVLTHVFEGLRLMPWMHWGETHSVGHYLDLSSAILGVTLLGIGYAGQLLVRRRSGH